MFFVHGYGSGASVWNDLGLFLQTPQYNYPPEFLEAINITNNKGSNVTAATQIADAIGPFLDRVNAYLNEQGYPGPRKTRVDIVSHSMGALSTRWYVAQGRAGLEGPPLPEAERVDSWISLAGASHGTDWEGVCNPPENATDGARELCPAFIQDPDPDPVQGERDKVQLKLNGPGGFKNTANDKDETPYGLGVDGQAHGQDPPRVVTRVDPNATQHVFYATIRCQPQQPPPNDNLGDALILPNDSTVVDGAGGRPIQVPAEFEETSAGNYQMRTATAFCHGEMLSDVSVQRLVALLLTTNSVNFDTPAPEHGPGPLDGVFEAIDFGSGQWAWEGPFSSDPTNHIYFNNEIGTSRTFQFSLAPRVLISMRVFSVEAEGTLTLSDDQGQTLTQVVTPGSMEPVVTNWTLPSTTVTVDFTAGWNLGIDDITYRR